MRQATALLMIAITVGCGGEERLTQLERPEVEVAKEGFCAEMAKVVCYNMVQCCTGAEIEATLGIEVSPTSKGCLRDVKLICERKHYLLLSSLAKGTAALRPEQASACLSSYLAAKNECFVLANQGPWVAACKEPISEGLLQVDEACEHHLECASNFCAADKKCKDLPGEGRPCLGQVCAPGLYCEVTVPTTPGAKQEAICRARRGENGSCQTDAHCEEGLYCELPPAPEEPTYPLEPQRGKCRSKREAGQVCSSDLQCSSNHCVPGLCSSNMLKTCLTDGECGGTCQESGSSCTKDSQCPGRCEGTNTPCSDDYYCEPGQACKRTCKLDRCIGPPVCGDDMRMVNYCADAVSGLLGKLSNGNDTPRPSPVPDP